METEVCSCSICREPVTREQMAREEIGDNHVYKSGELAYIELFHVLCRHEQLHRECKDSPKSKYLYLVVEDED